MFDVGFLELLVVAVVALVVVGPERLPKLARTVGMWVGRGRRFISSVKEDIDREIKADELRQILAKQKQSNPLHEIVEDTKKNFADIKSETESAVNAATKPAPPQNDKS
ncbi:MAG: twin-arginine translocase subunit TatB [Chromatiaceae bacterium]|nr:twin-arginine translocase subunit TatB [Gammaproteobacteria bacterium]MCP5300016.1 twin-arginine translocase subunit TatB [Chromatiaceae bacterium]MCP5422088.1 twin-arginine translocase subunit TatB [Chromatiaceae bacterium]